MKKNMKKIISSLSAICLIVSALAVGTFAYGSGTVAINATNFPDANFRTVVANECDVDGDGYLSEEEVAEITVFDVSGYLAEIDEDATISNLKGIEHFTSLTTLYCYGLNLTDGMNISALTNLTFFDCDGCDLPTLDVSKNTALKSLYCEANDLTALDVSKNTALTTLFCNANALTALDVSGNTALKVLHAEDNALTALDVSHNTALTTLFCSHNSIKELNLSNNTALTGVTDARIGRQTLSATANAYNSTIFIPVQITTPANIVSTSLDTTEMIDEVPVETIAYSGTSFYTKEIDNIKGGVDYLYNTGLSTAENMSVHIDVTRDFFLVKFFTSADMTTLISSDVVSAGNAAAAPEISDAPQCKSFGGWSEDVTNVQSDLDAYIVWNDAHDKYVSSFENDVITVSCHNGCGETWTYHFSTMAGLSEGDKGYVDVVDINGDGIINGRDLVYLKTLTPD